MNQSGKPSSFLLYFIIVIVGVGFLALMSSNFVRDPWTSPANACINNLREIEGAKHEWTLEHNAKSNDLVTLDDIRPYLVPYGQPNGYIKLDAKGNLPKCPSGGVYTIGKVGESPTCSIGDAVTPTHVLP
jgi:hypothetical protein